MKRLLFFLLFGAGQTLYAQIITYDYLSSTYKSRETRCVHQDSTIGYRIINLNTFAKKVLINGRMINLSTDRPAEIATLFRIKTDDEQTEANKKLADTQKQITKMDEVKKEANDNEKAAAAPKKTFVAREAGQLDALVVACLDYYRKANKAKKILEDQKLLATTMTDGTHYTERMMEQALRDRGITKAAIDTLKTKFDAFEDAYEKANEQYTKAFNAAIDAGDKDHAARIKDAQEQVRTNYEGLEKQYGDALMNITDFFLKALNPANYAFISTDRIFVQDDIDELEFYVQVGGLNEDLSGKKPFKKTLRVSGGLKIDYSVGPVFKFISDDKFYLNGDTLKQRDKVKFAETVAPGIASMMHVYKRTCGYAAIGGMFGINADFKELTDVNLGFLFGGSAILGRSQKVIVSTGVSYSNVNRLKTKEYSVGSVYKDAKIESVTERVLRPSFFVSFSLAISRRNVVKID
ncbi:hypothetical protein [Spirosoma fluviale]|uniref:Uncharacterized protein n=1 Tax=Spirosoma fluviale TaxID=1597977 RepID=A0A286G287_9BACT|nr:hypothetical protein [Spirosoma fluviale]SOD89593.1 hypothetical protein SAMN06269250_3123 [Spirosoma fluviale]